MVLVLPVPPVLSVLLDRGVNLARLVLLAPPAKPVLLVLRVPPAKPVLLVLLVLVVILHIKLR